MSLLLRAGALSMGKARRCRETRASLHWKTQWMLRDFQVRPDNFQVDLKTPRCLPCMKKYTPVTFSGFYTARYHVELKVFRST